MSTHPLRLPPCPRGSTWLRAAAAALLPHLRSAEVREACELLASLRDAGTPADAVRALLKVRWPRPAVRPPPWRASKLLLSQAAAQPTQTAV
jgi:hypothetical protein